MHRVQQVLNRENVYQNPHWGEVFSDETDLGAVTQAKEQLAKIDSLTKKNLKVKIQFALNLDEKVYPKVQSLTHNYLTSLRSNDTFKKSVEATVYEYLRRLYATYTLILDDVLQQKKVKYGTDEMNLILVRYLNALFLMTKWRYFEDQEAPLSAWSNVHRVIKLAESLTITNKNLFLYKFQNKETNIASQLRRGFMLDSLQQGSYSQLQIELTDRVISAWSTDPIISTTYDQSEHQFFIHLEGDKRPQRLRGEKECSSFRYWKTRGIVDLIESYLCAVETRKDLGSFNLDSMASTEDLVRLFKKLRVDWCVKGYKRQRRAEGREQNFNILNMLNVTHGVEEVCLCVERAHRSRLDIFKAKSESVVGELGVLSQESLMESYDSQFEKYGTESWTMLEESPSGFSVEIGEEISPWVKSGVLIGYSKIEDKAAVIIAEIKTVRKSTNGCYRLGLLKVTNSAMAVKVSLVQKSSAFDPVQDYEVDDGKGNLSYSAMFLSLLIDEGEHKKSKLVVPKSMYRQAHRYQVTTNGEQHMMLAGEVLNKHHNWVCFEVII